MTFDLTSLQWREPLWLLLVFLPLLLRAWRKRDGGMSRRLGAYADAHLLPQLLTGPSTNRRSAGELLLGIAWLLAAVAAAGPYLAEGEEKQEQRRGIDLAVLIDISPSMNVTDVTPSRLQRAKLELRDFAQRLGGSRVGLVAFSRNAYTLLPLTHDRTAFLHTVDLLDVSLPVRRGTHLARGLEVAEQLLEQGGERARAILLVRDRKGGA